MWVKIDEVFDENDAGRYKKSDDKVISSVRKAVDDLGYRTVGGFARSAFAFLIMAIPADVDVLVSQRTLTIPAISTCALNIYRACQIEVESTYEIAVAGFTSTRTLALLKTATVERDFRFYTMRDGAATDKVLASANNFNKNFHIYHLATPQLLFSLNTSAAYRVDPHAVITAGADKVNDTISNLTRRIELDNSIGVITTLAATVTNCQEEMGCALFSLQHDTQLSIDLATFFRPINNDKKEQAHVDIEMLKATRTNIAAKLAALRGNTPLIAALGPAIPLLNTLITAITSPATLPPNPAISGPNVRPPKRPRTSVDGPDPSPTAVAVQNDDLN
ncbi:hypothetical protein B0H17DRAFT_1217099 [Mycena rosella]|uniref:Uncharacterized protein n=1 Tax=Mycena rosella TaxID=1033263 RepID=A0AAD7FQE9_MYCRO|nr:hypothetical protein B0H17DRAFT_1217099 [Mycena rosella]